MSSTTIFRRLGATILTIAAALFCASAAHAQRPANDGCYEAVTLPLPGDGGDSTAMATIDAWAATCGAAQSAPGVWYRVIGDGSTITASLCGKRTQVDFDTRLSVFCGGCATLTCIEAADDTCAVPGGGGPPIQSEVSWCSEAGRAYLILVHGSGASVGDFVISVTSDGVPCEPRLNECVDETPGACCIGDEIVITGADSCAAMGGAYLGPFTSIAGTMGATQAHSVSLSFPIPNPGIAISTIPVPDSFTVGDINVGISIPSHTSIGDLRITLMHGGRSAILWNRGCLSERGLNVVFDDEGITVACGPQPVTGTIKPAFGAGGAAGALAVFDGLDSSGDWTLMVEDLVADDSGLWTGWSVRLTAAGEPATCPCAGDLDGDGVVGASDLAALLGAWGSGAGAPADLDGNGVVGAGDLAALLGAWGAC